MAENVFINWEEAETIDPPESSEFETLCSFFDHSEGIVNGTEEGNQLVQRFDKELKVFMEKLDRDGIGTIFSVHSSFQIREK